METQKVFEFAKEIGIETLALMDKIREWKLPVKSHMADLDLKTRDQIKVLLEEEAPNKKKKTTKKKVAKAKKKVSSAKKKPTTTITKAGTGVKASSSVEPIEKTKKTKSKKIIRRKKADEEAEEMSSTEIEEELSAAESKTESVEQPQIEELLDSKEKDVLDIDIIDEKTEEKSKEQILKPETTLSEKIDEVETSEEKSIEIKKIKKEEADLIDLPSESKETKPVKAQGSGRKKVLSRKKEVTIGASGLASKATPIEISKKAIVGRMDLSRVQSNQSERNRSPHGSTLRTGFVSQDSMSFVDPNEDSKKEKDLLKDKAKKQPKSPGVKSEQSTHFSSSDFRKREMVFQPKKKRLAKGEGKKTQITTPKASKRVVKVHQTISLSELASGLNIKAPLLIKKLVSSGVMANMNTELDFDTVALIVPEFGFEAVNTFENVNDIVEQVAFGELDAEHVWRPPVVTVMGHVDHGKTSLLDSIRKTDVASGEAGGITQHIGAYQVQLDGGQIITFIDTPGHEAFTAMRARGANITDIVILVVAADDGVMPQTIEAINHAKAAGVPIVVAVNKMDRPNANPDRIKQQMTEYELIPEEWGGQTIFAETSAISGEGVKELLEQIFVLSEVMEFKANPKRSGSGIVIESRQERGRGNVATFLVKEGTLKLGQYVVAGTVKGKVRNLYDYHGKAVKEAGPSFPVEVLGLDFVPDAGEAFYVCKDEKAVEHLIEVNRISKKSEEDDTGKTPHSQMSLEELFSKVRTGELKELPIVLKTDVAGSSEAIISSLDKLSTEEVKVRVIHSAVGAVSESDVLLAATSSGLIIGFNVRPDSSAQQIAKEKGIEVRCYSIIYELLDEIKKAMSGLLDPDKVEKIQGRVEVRNTFSVPKVGTIAGCFVIDGKIHRNDLARLIRDGRVIYEGKLSSLKRFKDDAREVVSGYECGIGIENFNDIKVGDEIETYRIEEIAREL